MDEAFLIWRLIIVLEFVKSLVNSIMKKQKKKEDVVGKINLKKKKKGGQINLIMSAVGIR